MMSDVVYMDLVRMKQHLKERDGEYLKTVWACCLGVKTAIAKGYLLRHQGAVVEIERLLREEASKRHMVLPDSLEETWTISDSKRP